MLYVVAALGAAVVLGVAIAALRIIQSGAREAGAATASKAATDAANAAIVKEMELQQAQGEIVAQEASKDDTVGSLRRGDF